LVTDKRAVQQLTIWKVGGYDRKPAVKNLLKQ